MEASLHSHDVYTAELAENQRTGMSFYRRNGEVGNLTIRNDRLISNL